ncbi:TPA: hypothetical protein EYP66_13415 [Candidatus Poribacteria bacterium]|nr:hypothetical protein [Candidatus Poribacteria bacterium]
MGTLKAGFAKLEITPKVPAYLAGYAVRNKPSESVHDPLFLHTMVMDDGELRMAILANDLCLISNDLINELRKMIANAGFAAEHIFVATTHTHSGPVTGGDNVDMEWLEGLKHKMVASVLLAEKRLQPVRIGIGKGRCNVGMNRRERQPDGTIRLGKNPDGPVDTELGVIRFDDMDGNPLALVLNYGCHGTTLGGHNYQISGDYMGEGIRLVEKQAKGQPDSMFLTGASGNVDPRHRVGESFEHVSELAEELAADALSVNSQLTTQDVDATIQIFSKTINVPRKTEEVEKGADENIAIPVSLVRLNDLLLITFPGELFAEIGMELKRRSPSANTFIVGYCNGSVGYLPTQQAYEEGGYEVNATHCSPEAEIVFVDGVSEMMRQIQ